jgi:MoaA/NifB/PqqE/SkfB family radical SAM enzyme
MISQKERPGELERPLNYWEWVRFGPFLAQVVIIRRCNLSCAYCSEFDKTSEPVSFQDLILRFKKLRDFKTWAVCLTGGEPTLHPRLPDLIGELKSLGFPRRLLITNGYFLSRDLIQAFNEAGLTDLQISIDGVTPNETTIKVLEPLRKKLSLLAEFARFKVVMSGVIGSSNPKEALEVIDFARQNNFIPRILFLHDNTGQLKLDKENLEAYRMVKQQIGRRFEDPGGYREELILTGRSPFKCRAGSRYLYIDEFGKVHWCSQTQAAYAKRLLDYSLDDLRQQFYTPKNCTDTCTVGCSRTASAYDNWRNQRAGSHQQI